MNGVEAAPTDAEFFDIGDHVTTDGLAVHAIIARRLTPESKSGISFRLLPSADGEWIDGARLTALTGYSDKEWQ